MLVNASGGKGGDGGTAAGGIGGGSGGDGGRGGRGGTAYGENRGLIETQGAFSDGMRVRSAGGVGGDGAGGFGLIVGSGGNGGGPTVGGNATGVNAGTIRTSGDFAGGMVVQSIGGGGGDGGGAFGAFGGGGSGASGNNGATASATNTGTITTSGRAAVGMLVESIGGGGGNGAGAAGGLVSIGGRGGGGGNGGSVITDIGGSITTGGDGSHGLLAQSVGGGGGTGGFATAIAPISALSIGGRGEIGGAGGEVNIIQSDVAAQISTSGRSAIGIFAQSVGGGGGNGGGAFSASDLVSISIGGSGAAAGSGAEVSYNVGNANITTRGVDSAGILIQSVGGGGGNGGFTLGGSGAIAVGVGGSSDAGAAGGAITATAGGTVSTFQDRSSGIIAQSLGGGGGNGGFTFQGGLAGAISVGGSGTGGGDAGTVSLTSSTEIHTRGRQSHAILAQSVGGGGGSGGFATAAVGPSIAVGGSGSRGGLGRAVTVTNTGALRSDGHSSHGILAQSIGGGGGDGGVAVSGGLALAIAVGGTGGRGGSASPVTVNNTASINTGGRFSHGILAQAIGGGGGNGGSSSALSLGAWAAASVAVGGAGGDGGNGGVVDLTHAGDIRVTGAGSKAIFAQSVGGGGGTGGTALAGAFSVGVYVNVNTPVSVGGFGGNGGDAGGQVTLRADGNITADAAPASGGIVAQSIGGGGGNGGRSTSISSGASTNVSVNLGVAVGGTGGAGGAGGAVRVETGLSGDGRVATQGSEAVGIMAQSIGGGGGNGGDSWGGAGGFGPNVTVNATVTVGGFAGNGSHAGTVFMDNRMAVFTRGQQSSAIVAQSIGGGGGNAGSSSGHTGSVAVSGVTVNANVSVGGTGGRASHGNTITLANRGSLRTFGDFSSGIMAQSIGGGGGFGGASNAKAFSIGTADATQIDVNVGIGGSGGGGGDGRAVTLNNYGEIRTSGYQAYGIMAMSVGGGGGTAGAAAVGGSRVIGTGKATVSVGAAIGLAGGSAGHGGEVTVTNDSRIVTSGDDSYAISASSIGGGGGIGGSAKASAEAEYAIGGGIGGFGGGAGNGGAVTVRNLSGGGVETQSARSIGVFAQSVGGSGGSGGAGQSTGNGSTVGVALTLGGFGAGGGNGASVTVANAGQVHTRSDYAHGIMAQSIGGSGGVGGAAGATSSGDTVAIGLTLGGLGGDGGTASRVTVNNSASGIVRTEGNNAYGVFAQSVGGGGGAAGAGSTTGGGGSVGVNLALGGIGGAGNSGGAVNVDNAGRIETAGDLSHGIFAQSIGGGGGASGAAANASEAKTSIGIQSGLGAGGGAHGGNVTVDNGGDIGTSGDGAHGIFAQSIGGGGGYGGVVSDASAGDNAFAVSVGGIGAGGGDGGDVLVNVSGSIVTRGERAHGVVAQSVGGSGGYGGDAKGKAGGQLAIGGSGGSGGDGGDVTVIRTGQIITLGKDSVAIMAQSVAGGGGVGGAGFGRFTTSDDGSGPNSIGFQIPSGSTGQGGIVRIVQSGQVHTFGNRGHGIVAQAVAGGGGMGGSTSLAAGQSGAGSAGGVGDAQAAEATANDQVNVRGAQSYALFGQSAAGRGNAAAVTLTAQSNLFAQGDGSVAVYGESTASGAKGDITINLNGAYTIGGAQNGAAVMLVGGAQNTVTNRGLLYAMGHDFDYIDATDLIGVVNPTPGLAPLNAVLGSLFDDFSPLSISGTGGNDQIINQRSAETLGRVIGNVDLGGGVNAFHNRANASMIGLQSINLGGGLYTNDGLYSNQGVGIVASVEVGGGFTQIATGTFVTDIDLDTQTNDHVALTGAGDFAGVAPLNFTSIDRVMGDYTLARGASMTLSGLTPTYRPTVGFDFRTRVDNGTDLVLYADKPTLKSLTNDPGAGVTDNGAVQMAQYLDGLEGVMSPADAPSELARMINMLRMSPDLPTFGETMMRLTPHYAVHTYEMVSRSADTALDAAGSCRRSPATAQTGNCFWFNGIPDSEYQRDPGEGAAFRDDAFRQISIGATRAIDDRWTLGATVARTSFDSSLSFQDELLSETRGRSTQVHALAKYSDGPYFADFALGYGRGKFTGSRDTSMAPVEFIPGETLAGDYLPALLHDGIGNSVTYSQNVKQVNLSTRLGYTFQYDQGYYLKPNVRLDGRWIRAKGEETGSVAALRFDGPLLRDPRL